MSLPITEFAIYGLHGDKDIVIPIEHQCKILISENGMGKTTVLKALYATLTCQFFRLNNLEFKNIIINFPSEEIILQKDNKNIDNITRRINKNFTCEVLYLPTYRRLEADLYQMGYIPKETGLTDNLLQSGMTDVEEKIKQIASGLENTFLGWFGRLNPQVWEQLIKEADIDEVKIENLEALKAVINRIYAYLIEHGKEKILQQFDPQQIGESDYNILDDFFSDIIQAYEEEAEKDAKVNQFIQTCNRYFFDKQLIYNKNNWNIEVQTHKNRPLAFESLSLGEKQLISIFSKLYLTSEKPLIILIDEPELSISIEWQRMLLPDILKSPRCHFLLAATHSPFIFDNDLNIYTVALNEYIREHEK